MESNDVLKDRRNNRKLIGHKINVVLELNHENPKVTSSLHILGIEHGRWLL